MNALRNMWNHAPSDISGRGGGFGGGNPTNDHKIFVAAALERHKIFLHSGRQKLISLEDALEILKKTGQVQDIALDRLILHNLDAAGLFLLGADLQGYDFFRADFSSAILTDANLKFARLMDVNLTNAELENTELAGATLFPAKIDGADFSGAVFNGTPISIDLFHKAKLTGTQGLETCTIGFTEGRSLSKARMVSDYALITDQEKTYIVPTSGAKKGRISNLKKVFDQTDTNTQIPLYQIYDVLVRAELIEKAPARILKQAIRKDNRP